MRVHIKGYAVSPARDLLAMPFVTEDGQAIDLELPSSEALDLLITAANAVPRPTQADTLVPAIDAADLTCWGNTDGSALLIVGLRERGQIPVQLTSELTSRLARALASISAEAIAHSRTH